MCIRDRFPARKATYDIQGLKDPKQDLFNLYPEAPLCRNCNACTEACPQSIDVREGVWKAVFGDFKSVSEMFMDCVMCGCLLYTSDAADERSSVDLGGR